MTESTKEVKIVTAAFLIIGNEILSGKTQDTNLQNLSKNLNKIGIRLSQARVVLDIEEDIIFAVRELCAKYNYVFTSGGIGPTHDDITTNAIAKAFGAQLYSDDYVYSLLETYYKNRGDAMNEGRAKMAIVPQGCTLIENEISTAPGFALKNVFVFAGIPRIFNAMLNAAIAKNYISGGSVMHSQTVELDILESVIAKQLSDLQVKYPLVEIGSYPQIGYTQIVATSYYPHLINEVIALIKTLAPMR